MFTGHPLHTGGRPRRRALSLLARAVGWKLTDTMMISFHRVERAVAALLESAVQSTDAVTAFGAVMRTYRQRRLLLRRLPIPKPGAAGVPR